MVGGEGLKWVAASGLRGVETVQLKVKKGKHRVRLHFLEPDKLPTGGRVFDIFLNGKPVQRGFDIARAAGGYRRSVVREFETIIADGNLKIELRSTSGQPPLLSGVEW